VFYADHWPDQAIHDFHIHVIGRHKGSVEKILKAAFGRAIPSRNLYAFSPE
jgi:diadenosine tetraphosphate (Ap4A) HIT family hydrolase